jgi:peptidoglycan hydrolase-like protein with peptidoglycan-binding domain
MNTFPPTPEATPDASEQTVRQQFADWPVKGDERPQPWDLDACKIPKADRELEDGAPDTISPVAIRHSYPILSTGSTGSPVTDLATRLKVLGYPTDISRGENPFGILTDSVMQAVEQFREDYNVQEDPTPYGSGPKARERAASVVGPYTWEGLIRASDRELQTA